MESTNRTTQLVIVIGFLILYLIFQSPYWFYIALGIGVLSLISKRIGDGIVWLWMSIGRLLGWVNSRILLTIIYLFVLTPIAFFSRIWKDDALGMKKKEKGSYYVERNHQFKKENFEEMW